MTSPQPKCQIQTSDSHFFYMNTALIISGKESLSSSSSPKMSKISVDWNIRMENLESSVEGYDCMKNVHIFPLLPDVSLKIMKSRADQYSPRLLVAQLECFIKSAPIRYTCLYTNYIVASPISSCTAKTSLKHFGSHTQRNNGKLLATGLW